MERIVFLNLNREGSQLVRRWQLPVNKQKCYFKESSLFGKLFDWEATVLKNAIVTIDKRYAGNTANCVHVRRVKGAKNFAL